MEMESNERRGDTELRRGDERWRGEVKGDVEMVKGKNLMDEIR